MDDPHAIDSAVDIFRGLLPPAVTELGYPAVVEHCAGKVYKTCHRKDTEILVICYNCSPLVPPRKAPEHVVWTAKQLTNRHTVLDQTSRNPVPSGPGY